jgi:hypothetical protein
MAMKSEDIYPSPISPPRSLIRKSHLTTMPHSLLEGTGAGSKIKKPFLSWL